jgi:hypothetical protein
MLVCEVAGVMSLIAHPSPPVDHTLFSSLSKERRRFVAFSAMELASIRARIFCRAEGSLTDGMDVLLKLRSQMSSTLISWLEFCCLGRCLPRTFASYTNGKL